MKTYTEPARTIPVAAETEVLIAGGGPAGIGAALGAARAGAKVMIVEQSNALGGMATGGMMSHWSGGSTSPLLDEIMHRACESTSLPKNPNEGYSWCISHECLKSTLLQMMDEAGVKVQLYTQIADVIMDGNRVAGIITESKSGREAIMADPTWNNGNYREQPQKGLAIARMLGHITYLSEESMRHKFGRRLQSSDDYSFDFSTDFRVESYLNYQGNCFVERFDANSYLYITRAIDYFDVSDQAGGDNFKVFDNVHCPFLVVSFSSDWLFPEYHGRDMARTLIENGNDVTFCNIQSDYGHDAFLLEAETLSKLMIGFLSNIYMED